MRTVFVCAALLVLPAGAGAQTLALTESQLVAQVAESPAVVAARSGVDVARADVLAAARWPNPRVTFNREAVAGVAEHMLMVSQVLPVTGRRRLEVEAAAVRVEASTVRSEDRIRRFVADSRLAFTSLWASQARERELITSRDRLDELAVIIGRREAAGEAAGFDRLRAEREVLTAEALRSEAVVERGRAQALLAGYLPAGGNTAIDATRPAPSVAPLPTVDELMTRAQAARGDLVALSRDAEAAVLAGRAAGRRVIPEPEVVAGTKTSNVAGGDVGSIVSVHVSIPLFDRGQPERAAALARERQARAEADALSHSIRAQITAWHAALAERRAIADRHRSRIAADGDDIERIAQLSYEAGERTIGELLDAYRIASATRLRQVELDAAVREAEIELEFVSGWELP